MCKVRRNNLFTNALNHRKREDKPRDVRPDGGECNYSHAEARRRKEKTFFLIIFVAKKSPEKKENDTVIMV